MNNLFPLVRRYSKQKARSRLQAPPKWWQALDRAFSFLLWVIKRKKGIKACISVKGYTPILYLFDN